MNAIFRHHISQCAAFTSREFERIEGLMQQQTWPKKKRLLEAGQTCHFEGFIISGCVKVYFLDPEGHEVILYIGTEGWWVSDVKSFHEGGPSRLYIETLEPTELWCLDLPHKNQLIQEIPALERVFRLMVQSHLASLQDRIYELTALNAEQRYQKCLQRYPHWTQRLPQHLIAAYVGISPESLSRIRKKWATSGTEHS